MKSNTKDNAIILGLIIGSVVSSLIFLAVGTWVVALVWRAVQ